MEAADAAEMETIIIMIADVYMIAGETATVDAVIILTADAAATMGTAADAIVDIAVVMDMATVVYVDIEKYKVNIIWNGIKNILQT